MNIDQAPLAGQELMLRCEHSRLDYCRGNSQMDPPGVSGAQPRPRPRGKEGSSVSRGNMGTDLEL